LSIHGDNASHPLNMQNTLGQTRSSISCNVTSLIPIFSLCVQMK